MTDKWTPKQVNPNDTQRQMTWDEIANALAASERQRKELEAQVAVLVVGLREFLVDDNYENHEVSCKADQGETCTCWQAPLWSLLASLPQAVQRHLERNKAVGGEVRE